MSALLVLRFSREQEAVSEHDRDREQQEAKKIEARERSKILEGKCWSTPVISDGRIYARSTREAVCLTVGEK